MFDRIIRAGIMLINCRLKNLIFMFEDKLYGVVFIFERIFFEE
jgi:hypothetical protein